MTEKLANILLASDCRVGSSWRCDGMNDLLSFTISFCVRVHSTSGLHVLQIRQARFSRTTSIRNGALDMIRKVREIPTGALCHLDILTNNTAQLPQRPTSRQIPLPHPHLLRNPQNLTNDQHDLRDIFPDRMRVIQPRGHIGICHIHGKLELRNAGPDGRRKARCGSHRFDLHERLVQMHLGRSCEV